VKRPLAGALAIVVWTAACAGLRPCMGPCDDPLPPKYKSDPATVATRLELSPSVAWSETSLTVRRGDELLFVATGQVTWGASNASTSPDGQDGVAGWHVGRGGLVGKIGPDGTPFDIGARDKLFPDKHPRPPHHPYPPPPIKMPRNGRLFLGFKDFTAGANTGMFTVTIDRAIEIPH
jgi:hypothetical protein